MRKLLVLMFRKLLVVFEPELERKAQGKEEG